MKDGRLNQTNVYCVNISKRVISSSIESTKDQKMIIFVLILVLLLNAILIL